MPQLPYPSLGVTPWGVVKHVPWSLAALVGTPYVASFPSLPHGPSQLGHLPN